MGEKDNVPTFTEAEKLEWIQTHETLREMRKSSESGLKEKMFSKIKQNPVVPIGMLATTLALSFGLMAMKDGNKRKSQLMMRARICAQGFTIGAILVGIVVAAGTKPATTTQSEKNL